MIEVWCERAKEKIDKDSCIQEFGGQGCPWWNLCWP
jgi:hypothetical protein